jgi:hypothetical protein
MHLYTQRFLCAFSINMFLILSSQAQDYTYQWAVQGAQSGDFIDPVDVCSDNSGNSYVLFQYSEAVTFGSVTLQPLGANDIGVVKFNSEGVAQWAANAGSAGNDRGNALAASASGEVYVTGYITGNAAFGIFPPLQANHSDGSTEFFVGKISANGQWLWVRGQQGLAISEGKDITVDPTGNVVVGGNFFGADLALEGEVLSTLDQLPFVAKYASSGQIQWAYSPQTDWGATLAALACGSGGEIYFCGSFGTSEVPFVELTAGDITLTNTGDSENGITAADLYILSLNADGVPQWAKNAGALYYECYASDITVGSDGQVYVSGFYQDSLSNYEGVLFEALGGTEDYDSFLGAVSSSGEWLWLQQLGTASYDLGQTRLASSPNGVPYLSISGLDGSEYTLGATPFTPEVGNTSLLARINTDGSFLWTFSTNDIYGFCASAENQFRITGEFAGSASFGDISLNATGGASNDVYLCKVQYGPDIPQSIAQNSVEFGVYPHPASDIIHIKTNYDISYVSIIDAEGREVLATKDKTISVHHLSPGMYFIKALSETGETFGKPLLKL